MGLINLVIIIIAVLLSALIIMGLLNFLFWQALAISFIVNLFRGGKKNNGRKISRST